MSVLDEKALADPDRDRGEAPGTSQAKAARVTGFEQLPAVLTSREAASALRMGLKELRQLIERGELPAARLGPRRVIRIAKSAIVRLLDGESALPPPSSPAVGLAPCKPVRRWKGRTCQRD